jgi:hypothetical protein
VELLKRNSSRSHVSKNEGHDLLLLNLLNRLAELNLRHVPNQLNRRDATLFEDDISEVSV